MGVHTAEVRVRYEETDQAGVVYHANYLRYFEVGRTEMMRALGLPYADVERRGILLTVVETHLVYREPAKYDDLLTVETRPTEIRRVRMRLDTRILRRVDDRVLAEGWIWLAAVSKAGRIAALPTEVSRALGADI